MKKDYMTRLEGWARWMLPPSEAEDVIADYRDIVADSELCRDLGKPREVIAPLAEKKAYCIWLAVFALLAACALLPGLSPLPGMAELWIFLCNNRIFDVHLGDILPLAGMAAALVWFRWKGQKLKRLPRAVPILLAVAAVWSAGVLAVDWLWLNDPMGFAEMWGEMEPLIAIGPMGYSVYRSVYLLNLALEWGGFAMALLAVFALVRARTGDRRWIAVYMLALTAVLLSWQTLSFMHNMSLDGIGPDWWMADFQLWVAWAAVGAVGTGAALC